MTVDDAGGDRTEPESARWPATGPPPICAEAVAQRSRDRADRVRRVAEPALLDAAPPGASGPACGPACARACASCAVSAASRSRRRARRRRRCVAGRPGRPRGGGPAAEGVDADRRTSAPSPARRTSRHCWTPTSAACSTCWTPPGGPACRRVVLASSTPRHGLLRRRRAPQGGRAVDGPTASTASRRPSTRRSGTCTPTSSARGRLPADRDVRRARRPRRAHLATWLSRARRRAARAACLRRALAAGLRGRLRRVGQHDAAGGTSGPRGDSATSRRTTRRRSPASWRVPADGPRAPSSPTRPTAAGLAEAPAARARGRAGRRDPRGRGRRAGPAAARRGPSAEVHVGTSADRARTVRRAAGPPSRQRRSPRAGRSSPGGCRGAVIPDAAGAPRCARGHARAARISAVPRGALLGSSTRRRRASGPRAGAGRGRRALCDRRRSPRAVLRTRRSGRSPGGAAGSAVAVAAASSARRAARVAAARDRAHASRSADRAVSARRRLQRHPLERLVARRATPAEMRAVERHAVRGETVERRGGGQRRCDAAGAAAHARDRDVRAGSAGARARADGLGRAGRDRALQRAPSAAVGVVDGRRPARSGAAAAATAPRRPQRRRPAARRASRTTAAERLDLVQRAIARGRRA